MPFLNTPQAKLFYIQGGCGPDIVWIPGGDSVATDWEEQFGAFGGEYRNTSFDPRGAGQTVSLREPPWLIENFAEDCAALIRAVCSPPVVVVGLSMGSLIVIQLVLDHPELVRTAIAMGVSGRAEGFLVDWLKAEVEFRRQGGRLSRDFAVCHYAAFMYPPQVLNNPALWAEVKPIVDRIYGERDGDSLAAQWQACIEFDATDRLPTCSVPLHVIAFSEDLQAPPEQGRRVAELAPNGHFHLLDGLGHVSLAGHEPSQVIACIRQILDTQG
jgi:3-oxoadipate enol-lactonase